MRAWKVRVTDSSLWIVSQLTRKACAPVIDDSAHPPTEAAAPLQAARQAGAGGVGLYRTEFLFMGRPALPDESEDRLREVELARMQRMAKLANIEPMTPGQSALWFMILPCR